MLRITTEFEPCVNVVDAPFGKKCWIQKKGIRCRKPAKFMVFADDGRPKSSRLDANVCEKHLPDAVRAANEYNRKEYPPGKGFGS